MSIKPLSKVGVRLIPVGFMKFICHSTFFMPLVYHWYTTWYTTGTGIKIYTEQCLVQLYRTLFGIICHWHKNMPLVYKYAIGIPLAYHWFINMPLA